MKLALVTSTSGLIWYDKQLCMLGMLTSPKNFGAATTRMIKDEIFEVEKEAASMSKLIAGMIEDGGPDDEYPLPNVKSAILSKIIEYMNYHKDHPAEQITKPLRSSNLAENNVSQWDIDFINVPNEILFEIIPAANYMDIRPLLELGCAKTASMIRGKTVEQIREEFNIVNDFTPEEEAKIREENRWCEDA